MRKKNEHSVWKEHHEQTERQESQYHRCSSRNTAWSEYRVHRGDMKMGPEQQGGTSLGRALSGGLILKTWE